MKHNCFTILFFLLFFGESQAQHSVAREWNEQVLSAIRNDFARPTVHARNLFHISAAMYDAWAAYETEVQPYFLGQTVHGFYLPYHPVGIPSDVKAAQEKAISYAAYRLILHRFENAPFSFRIHQDVDTLMAHLGYDVGNTSVDYHCGAAELGNYIAQQIIAFGMQDGANEANLYENRFYQSSNPPLLMELLGNPDIEDMNRWQPLQFANFIDQAGNAIGASTPDFLSPEWGSVLPFSLEEEDAVYFEREGNTYQFYHDPGPPVFLNDLGPIDLSNPYKWGNILVALWSSHLDPTDPTVWDISPAAQGNNTVYPTQIEDYDGFYNFLEGGDYSPGHSTNPSTGQAYAPNLVKRGDYARVLAEFWADGPESETPPGHWFTILNTVHDHPLFERKFEGKGAELDKLEWDVKAYFMLGGAMHDAAVAVWGIKGWYDYIRPVSAIRGMAEFGQSSDLKLPNYHPFGFPFLSGYVEMIDAGDALAGDADEYVGEVKIKAWKGPNFIDNPLEDTAKVDWIRALEWYPYQRPSFVTPPFAGYVSGHSTFSRAAAEVLTALTGDPFFPGGMGSFYCPQNEFLVFEEGPSTDITLQWATYRDASDQCSLSRIWGGIHPPVDDIPGRLIGLKIGVDAFEFAKQYFEPKVEQGVGISEIIVFPNPTNCGVYLQFPESGVYSAEAFLPDGKLVAKRPLQFRGDLSYFDLEQVSRGLVIVIARDQNGEIVFQEKVLMVE